MLQNELTTWCAAHGCHWELNAKPGQIDLVFPGSIPGEMFADLHQLLVERMPIGTRLTVRTVPESPDEAG